MMTFEPAITVAASADRALVTDIIARAFAADPPSRWLYPDDDQYWRFFPRFVEVFGGSAIGCGTAEIAADGGATALWLPPGAHPDEAALGALLLAVRSDGQPPPGRSALVPAAHRRPPGAAGSWLRLGAPRARRRPVRPRRPAGVSRVDEPEKRQPVSATRVRGGRGDSRGKRATHLSNGEDAKIDQFNAETAEIAAIRLIEVLCGLGGLCVVRHTVSSADSEAR
jgi:hypothetical protein